MDTARTENGYSCACDLLPGWVVACSGDFEQFKKEVEDSIKFYIDCAKEDNDEYPAVFDGEYEIIKHSKGRIGLLKSTWASGSVLKGNTSGKFFDKVISERKDIDGLKCLYKVDGIGEDGLGYRYFTGPKKATTTKGLFYAGVPLDRQEEIASGKASRKYLPISNLYDFSPDFGNCRHEGGVELVGGKKPEVLLEMLLGIFTNDGDLVLDAYSGTGTTAAVCMKMNRRFIAIYNI